MKRTRVPAVLLLVAGGLASVHAASAAQGPNSADQKKDVITAPGYAFKPNFGDYYPRDSKNAGEQGTVRVRVCYDVKGKILSSDAVESSGFARLDEAAVRAGRDVVIKPGTINGVPRADCAIFPAKFSLGGDSSVKEVAASKKQKTRETAELTYMPDIRSFYPRESKKAGEEGTAVVVACYDKKGKVISTELHSSSGFARLDEAAVRAGHKIRLDPALVDGVPQAGCGVIPLKFSQEH